MIEYAIVDEDDQEKFAAEVKAKLAGEWILQGGVSISVFVDPRSGNTKTAYAQAFCRPDPK